MSLEFRVRAKWRQTCGHHRHMVGSRAGSLDEVTGGSSPEARRREGSKQ